VTDKFSVDPALDRYATVSEFARALGVSRRLVHRWQSAGVDAFKADWIAVRLGLYADEIWPDEWRRMMFDAEQDQLVEQLEIKFEIEKPRLGVVALDRRHNNNEGGPDGRMRF
jgi:hypothetical protein